MNVSKDIMRLLISKYFDLQTVYQCQFLCKWIKSYISQPLLYQARCEIVSINVREKQNKFLKKRRMEDIKRIVNEEVYELAGKGNHLYLRKKLIQKYTAEEGDTRCYKCEIYGYTTYMRPNQMKEHLKTCTKKGFYNCQRCKTLNPNAPDSPHERYCPLFPTFCGNCNHVDLLKIIKEHCTCEGSLLEPWKERCKCSRNLKR